MDFRKAMAVNKKVAELILRAQNASDGGKNIDELVLCTSEKTYRDNKHGYAGKDMFIMKAIEMIARNRKNTNFRYSVVHDGEIADYLVYFDTTINGKKYQVSFHSFNNDLERFIRKSFKTEWDKKDSRRAAAEIYKAYFPNGRYVYRKEGKNDKD